MHDLGSSTGRYEVVRRIGAGGMGVVYEAEDRERGQRVALKTIPNPDIEQVYLLKREFRVLADLSHPNLVVLYDLVVDRDAAFFTMELVDGDDLLDYLWRRRTASASDAALAQTSASGEPLPDAGGVTAPAPTPIADLPRTALSLGTPFPVTPASRDSDRAIGGVAIPPAETTASPCDLDRLRAVLPQLARGLHALHQAGKIHRDVKPSNIRVTRDGRVVLLDFGLVTELDRRRGSFGSDQVVGTVGYMAPEQGAADVALTPAADWYAVGVVLFHALTGRLPFEGSPARVLLHKQTRDAPSPSQFSHGLPPDLVALCCELLGREPGDRPHGATLLRRLGVADTDPSLKPIVSRSADGGFAGRDDELSTMTGALAPLDGGRPSVIVVSGPSGMGKSTLVARFLDRTIAASDAVILRGRCLEREDVPYKAIDGLIDELSDFWLGLPSVEAALLLPREAALLPMLFPVLGRVPAIADAPRARAAIDPQALRSHAFDALRETLQRLAVRRRLILFLDDLQWVDRDTTTLLADLMRAPDPPALALVLATRADGAGAVNELVQRMDADVTSVDVGPLSIDAALGIAAAQLGDVSADELDGLVREAAGSPLFLLELARHLQGRSVADIAGKGLDAMISDRLDDLGADARLIADIVAIAGEPIARKMIAAASGLAPAELSRQLNHLRGQHVVRASGSRADDVVEPYHDRVREALIAGLAADVADDTGSPADASQSFVARGPERRAQLHRSLATALAGSGTPDQLARHWHSAGDPDRAAGFARRAGDEARQKLAFDRAARFYAMALDGTEWSSDDRRGLAIQQADALADAGRPREAASEFLRAADGCEATVALELRRRSAGTLLQSGYIVEGLALTAQVLREVGLKPPSSPWRSLAALMWRRAWLRLRGLGYRPRPLGEISQAELTRVDVCEGVSFGLAMVDTFGSMDFASRFLAEALRLGETWRVSRALALETDLVAVMARRRRAEALYVRLAELTARIATPAADVQLRTTRGLIDFFVHNQWRRALGALSEAIAVYRAEIGRAGFELDTVNMFACWARYYSGELGELSRIVPAMAEEATRAGNLYTSVTLRCAFPVAWLARLVPVEVEAAIDDAVRSWQTPDRRFQLQHLLALCSRVDLAIYRDALDVADAHVAEAWKPMRRSLIDRPPINMLLLRTTLTRLALARAARAAAGSAARRDALKTARRHARHVRRTRMPLVRAVATMLDGATAELAGDDARAVASYRGALTVLDEHTTDLFAHSMRDRLGRLVGGDEGDALRARSAAWLAAQDVREPDTLLAMLLPGPT
jgi:serine/threonine protein kinase